jgi:hypothetical protein
MVELTPTTTVRSSGTANRVQGAVRSNATDSRPRYSSSNARLKCRHLGQYGGRGGTSSASQLAKYASQARLVTSCPPGTRMVRPDSRLSAARSPVTNVTAWSNSRGLPVSVRSPLITSSSGWGSPESASWVTPAQIRSCSAAASDGSPRSVWPRPKRGPATCRMDSAVLVRGSD